MSFSSTSVDATIPLLPSGEAHIAATLEPAFDPSFTDSGKDANSHYRITVKGTGYAPTGTLTLPGAARARSGLRSAPHRMCRSRPSQPAARVRAQLSSTNGSCELTNADGDTADVFLGILDGGELFFD